jgi:cyclin-dependent kinase 7
VRWTPWVALVGKSGIDLILKTLRFDPAKRVSAKEVCTISLMVIGLGISFADRQHLLGAEQALHHPFFGEEPRPTPPKLLPKMEEELRPRALAPEELNGKPVTGGQNGAMKKRKAPSPSEAQGEGERKVARRLF